MRLLATIVASFLLVLPVGATKLVPQTRAQLNFSYAPLVRDVAPAVVNVYAARAERRARSPFANDPFFERFFGRGRQPRERLARSLGSGVVVDAAGTVVTNVHVVKGADELRVSTKDGREFEAELLLADEDSDIAVLRLREAEALDFIELGDSDALEVGDLVLAIGNPFGVGQTVTSGIVSGLARSQVGTGDFGFFIQTDASINPGNSGGALVGMDGRLVGINTAIFTRSGGSNGIGFAVPSNMVRVVLESARRGEEMVERPRIGATFQQVSYDLARALGMQRAAGALVVEVEPDGPAAAAGIRPGDVLLEFDGRRIEHLDALGYRLVTAGAGREVKLLVLSREARRTVPIRLARPPKAARPVRLGEGSPFAGASVRPVPPRLARRLGAAGGLEVTGVPARSEAARRGLRERDVLLSVNGLRLGTPDDLDAAFAARAPRYVVDLVRNGARLRTILR